LEDIVQHTETVTLKAGRDIVKVEPQNLAGKLKDLFNESNVNLRPLVLLCFDGCSAQLQVDENKLTNDDKAVLSRIKSDRAFSRGGRQSEDRAALTWRAVPSPQEIMEMKDQLLWGGTSSTTQRTIAEKVDSAPFRAMLEAIPEGASLEDSIREFILQGLASKDHILEIDAHHMDSCGGTAGGDEFGKFLRAKAAALTLARVGYGDGEIEQALISRLTDSANTPSVQYACAQALNKMRLSPDAIGTLVTALENDEFSPRRNYENIPVSAVAIAYALNGQLRRLEKDSK